MTPMFLHESWPKRTAFFLLGLWPVLFLTGCDAHQAELMVRPDIRITFVEPLDAPQTTAAKSAALWDVTLAIQSSSGTDYSPSPITIDDTQTSQAVFDVVLPSDSLYTFIVQYSQGSSPYAQGHVVYQVDRDTEAIDIPVHIRNGEFPSVAFVPSTIRARTQDLASINMTLFYFGSPVAITGLAGRFVFDGASPSILNMNNTALLQAEGNVVSVGWRWQSSITSDQNLGQIDLQALPSGRFCVESGPGEVRTVTQEGAITRLHGLQACVEILP